jgi:general nucleoside transport system permease protein
VSTVAATIREHRRSSGVLRWLGWASLAVFAYAVLILIYGKNPADAFHAIWSQTLSTSYGLQDVLVRMTPLLLVALAAAIPARVGLVNVGGEGQLCIGGIAATFFAITFTSWPSGLLLPVMAVAGGVGGGLWGALSGWLKTRGWLSEVSSTMLMNYIAVLAVSALVFDPWRDPGSSNFPQSREFVPAAQLPHFHDSRVDVLIVAAIVAVVALDWFLRRTRFGLEIRAIGGNPTAAAFNGVPVSRYVIGAMFVGGAFAGLAGMEQVSAFQLRLNPGLAVGLGYLGFLISWLSGHNPRLIIPMTFLLAVLASSGDTLQISLGLPAATVNVISAILMLIVLLAGARKRRST